MNTFTPMVSTLLDLAFELDRSRIPLIIGGGFGLYLKQESLRRSSEPTLLRSLPEPRSTNDIDLFLRVDVVASLDRMQEVARTLDRLGFQVMEKAKFFQWHRVIDVGGIEQVVKLDLLVGPLGDRRGDVKTGSLPRVRPKGDLALHVYHTDEAIAIDDESLPITIEGVRTKGEGYKTSVLIPQPFTYLMMKLFAFDDRQDDEGKDLGRHHAMDLYRIVGMMTEAEYRKATELGKLHTADARLARARDIIARSFSERTSLGILRIREHALFRDDFQLVDFMQALHDLFSCP